MRRVKFCVRAALAAMLLAAVMLAPSPPALPSAGRLLSSRRRSIRARDSLSRNGRLPRPITKRCSTSIGATSRTNARNAVPSAPVRGANAARLCPVVSARIQGPKLHPKIAKHGRRFPNEERHSGRATETDPDGRRGGGGRQADLRLRAAPGVRARVQARVCPRGVGAWPRARSRSSGSMPSRPAASARPTCRQAFIRIGSPAPRSPVQALSWAELLNANSVEEFSRARCRASSMRVKRHR